ncbi:unnamed protein product [Caretta caretta]
MDHGSCFFYALEKKRGAKKHITCLLAEDGTPLTDPEEMRGRARAFYMSLFSPDPTDLDACRVLWDRLVMASAGDQDQLELPLALAKLSEALCCMLTNKSPGMDELTVEFYHVFWDILSPDLVTVWAKSLESGVLPLSCRRALLALLPKKGDPRNLRNWCPILLLSMDYKEKEFNRVEHRYLLGTLLAFGFGPQFMGFLRVLYASTECLDPGNLVRVEVCQAIAIYSEASSTRVNWVKSSGLVVGDGWQASSLPPTLQAI